MKQAIGVDLGGTKIKIARVSETGKILNLIRLQTPIDEGGQAIYNLIENTLATMIKQEKPAAVGVGTPGLVAFPQGKIMGCTPNLPNWDGLELRAKLQKHLNMPIWIDNDANVAAWGEYELFYKHRAMDILLLTLGTGLGSGMILNKRLYRGHHQLGIGFGHMIVEASGRYCNCGQRGCLETYVSGTGLRKSFYLRGGALELRGEDIFQKASQGDKRAQLAIEEFLRFLAIGITSILNTLAPEFIVLGGGVSEQGKDRLLIPLREKIAAIMSMPLQDPKIICLAKLGENAGVIGAAMLALNEVKNKTV